MRVFASTASKNIYIAGENVNKYSIKVEPLKWGFWNIHQDAPRNTGMAIEFSTKNRGDYRVTDHPKLPPAPWNTPWLGGGNSNIFFIFTPTWGRFLIWGAYFWDGLKPPRRWGLLFVLFFQWDEVTLKVDQLTVDASNILRKYQLRYRW